MNHNDLPDRWKNKIIDYLQTHDEKERKTLNSFDFFPNMIAKIKFEDDSYAELRYPLVINAPEFNEVGVFTEHCGYHIFNLRGTYIDLVNELGE